MLNDTYEYSRAKVASAKPMFAVLLILSAVGIVPMIAMGLQDQSGGIWFALIGVFLLASIVAMCVSGTRFMITISRNQRHLREWQSYCRTFASCLELEFHRRRLIPMAKRQVRPFSVARRQSAALNQNAQMCLKRVLSIIVKTPILISDFLRHHIWCES